MLTTKKLSTMPYTQAIVRNFDDTVIVLRSYATDVAVIENNKLRIYGLYSATTRKHIKAFCAEYANITDFSTIKMIVADSLNYDILTGEITYR